VKASGSGHSGAGEAPRAASPARTTTKEEFMIRFLYRSKLAAPCCAAALLCALLLLPATTARANHLVTLSSVVTFNSALSLYTYNYSVTNNTADPVAVVSFGVFALPDAVLNPAAPSGFNLFFDAGLGQVDLVEDTQTFAPNVTVSGFTFQSAFAPNPSAYTYVNANTGQAFSGGTTLAPTVIPEPGTLTLGLGLAPGLLLVHRRRRRPSTK
jgi:hypothetical protein